MSTPSNAPDLFGALSADVQRKDLPYVRADGSPVGAVACGGEIFRGSARKSGDPFVIHQDGRVQQAIRAQALAAAIYHGVLTRAEITALWLAASRAPDMPADVDARDKFVRKVTAAVEKAIKDTPA